MTNPFNKTYRTAVTLGTMKVVLALLLILLILLVALPIGMGHMGDCPACTSTTTGFGIACAGVLTLVAMIVLLSSTRFRLAAELSRRYVLARSVYRPPRLA